MKTALSLVLVLLTGCASSAPAGGFLYIGDEGFLKSDVAVALTDAAFNQLNSAAAAKDEIGFRNVIISGDAVLATKGTRFIVIDRGLTSAKIRVLEGEDSGRAGWVPIEVTNR